MGKRCTAAVVEHLEPSRQRVELGRIDLAGRQRVQHGGGVLKLPAARSSIRCFTSGSRWSPLKIRRQSRPAALVSSSSDHTSAVPEQARTGCCGRHVIISLSHGGKSSTCCPSRTGIDIRASAPIASSSASTAMKYRPSTGTVRAAVPGRRRSASSTGSDEFSLMRKPSGVQQVGVHIEDAAASIPASERTKPTAAQLQRS